MRKTITSLLILTLMGCGDTERKSLEVEEVRPKKTYEEVLSIFEKRCSEKRRKDNVNFRNYNETEKRRIEPRQSYSHFAWQLQNENPEIFDGISIPDTIKLLKEMNGYPLGGLPANGIMEIPVYRKDQDINNIASISE